MHPVSNMKHMFDDSKDYLETELELTKLKIVYTSSDVISDFIYLIVFRLFGFLALSFLSIGLALVVGIWLGSYFIGFFITGGFSLIVFLIIYLRRSTWIKRPLTGHIIQKMTKSIYETTN